MKRLAYIFAVTLAFVACTREPIHHPSEAEAPATASLYEPVITVDQETNQVTFSVRDAKGIVPVWLFADNSGEFTVRQAQNDYTRIFASAGEYTVRMQIMNAAGVTPDYVERTFTIDNTIVDFTRYVRYVSGGSDRVWRINNSVDAHQACGESIDNPTGWWAAAPDEKAAFGLYDSRLHFDSEGVYTYEEGTVYVNKGVTQAPYGESGHDADYTVPVEETSAEYSFSVEGDAVTLSLPGGTPFPYIPNDDYLTEAKFYIQSISNKEMILVWYTATGNNGTPIAWQFILTSEPAGVKEDPLYGDGSRTWKMASELPGHMACGPDGSNPTGWWSAAPNEKAGLGVYDNLITFSADGTYVFDPGEDGLIYVNWGCTTVDGQAHAEPDFTYAWERQEGKYTYDGETITLPEHFTLGYIPNDNAYANPVFTITELTDEKLVVVSVIETIAWQMIFVPADGGSGEEPGGDDTASFDYNADSNLWKPADAAHTSTQYYAPDWAQIDDVAVNQDGATYSLSYPAATSAQWQAQFHIIPDEPIALEATKNYDFQVKLTTSENHGSITLKLTDTTNDGNFLFTELVSTVADEESTFTFSSLPGIDAAAVKMVFDFGGNAAGTDVTIREIILREHQGGGSDTPEPEEDFTTNDPSIPDSIFDIEGESNLWRSSETRSFDYWYAMGDWETQLEPGLFDLDEWGGLKIIVPKGIGGSEWQGQSKWHSGIPMSASKQYDIRFTISSDEDIYAFTVKLAKDGDDTAHSFYYENKLKLKAHVPYTFKVQGVSPDVDYESLIVIVDLGRAREGAAVSFTDFCVQESAGAVSYGENLWTEPTLETWFSGTDWQGGITPDAKYSDGKFTLTVPDGTGGQEWMGQVKLSIPVAVSASKQYDFSCKLLIDDNATVTVKLADANDDSNHAFFYDPAVAVTADTPLVYKQSPTAPDQDYTAVMLVLDFGRCPVGAAVVVSDFVLREIQ